jgi:hypothetical protein
MAAEAAGAGGRIADGTRLRDMAEHAPRRPATDLPPLDPGAVDRAYRYYRAQRHARVEHRRAEQMARLRFWFFVGLLLLASLVVAVTIWDEVERLFGL